MPSEIQYVGGTLSNKSTIQAEAGILATHKGKGPLGFGKGAVWSLCLTFDEARGLATDSERPAVIQSPYSLSVNTQI